MTAHNIHRHAVETYCDLRRIYHSAHDMLSMLVISAAGVMQHL